MVEMERSHKGRGRRNQKPRRKVVPRVPIPTWRWEDVRRARKRGGYPWTHLYKGPFRDTVHPDQFTMDAFRREKSSSPMGRPSTSEVSSWADYSGKTTPTLLHELINEPNKSSNSMIDNNEELDVQIKEFQTESAESSDNISQYLDKEEEEEEQRVSSPQVKTTTTTTTLSVSQEEIKPQAKTVEMKKKLQEMKKKLPKLRFAPKTDHHPLKVKATSKKTTERPKLKLADPVYIHIPLKPPPGETDEFSYLEFDAKREPKPPPSNDEEKNQPEKVETNDKKPLTINPAFKQLLKDVRELGAKEAEDLTSNNDDGDEEFQPITSSRSMRSRSAEPQTTIARRSSLESSYSRKSMSRLASMKKRLKDASVKIKNAFSMDSLRRKKEPATAPKLTAVVKTEKKIEKKPIEPEYIHIPLKLPEGQTDEYSHLVEGGDDVAAAAANVMMVVEPSKSIELRTDSLDSTSSYNPNNGIQLIFLTPPSDDELLDKELDIPETPSSDEAVPFSSLKKLAQDVVDQVSPETKQLLETVKEESDKNSVNELETGDIIVERDNEEETRMVVDEEDGLNECQNQSNNNEDVLKSAMKSAEAATQKRVSFKRKSKKTKEESEPLQQQSMSVDEEINYLDQKPVPTTSLEEDYAKWTTVKPSGDHEYELITPPPDVTEPVVLQSDTIDESKIEEQPIEEKKKSFFQRFHKDKSVDKQRRDSTGSNKFQEALKHGAEQIKTTSNQIKTKLHNIKKPDIHLPHFKLPKIPDTATLRIRNVSLPGTRKSTETSTVETIHSTESTLLDESEPKNRQRSRFDFTFGGTFPRLKRKKSKPNQGMVFGTVPRAPKATTTTTTTTIPLHSDESTEREFNDEPVTSRTGYEDRETSLDMVVASRQNVDDYERENRAINAAGYRNRWEHGNFEEHIPSQEERIIGQLVEQRFGHLEKDHESLEDRLLREEATRPIYVEEDNEFEMRMSSNRHLVTDLDDLEPNNRDSYYSSEGSLQQKGRLGNLTGIHIDSDEFFVVHEIGEGFHTPDNVLAQMNEYDPIGSNRSLPTPPVVKPDKKPTIRKPKRKKTPHVSQEEIPGDEESLDELAPSRPRRRSKKKRKSPEVPHGARLDFPRESLGILGDDEGEELDQALLRRYQDEEEEEEEPTQPDAPPRKDRSLKSLTQSENDSIMEPPKRPTRRSSRSNTSSLSRLSLPPSSIMTDDTQSVPNYLMDAVPCVEEPCVQNICDYMGYSVVDKTKPPREPPLPPPRTPPRKKRHNVEKFSTVPRNFTTQSQEAPKRPLRNYSTLSYVREATTSSDKENRDLVSGEIVQKMRARPLPAPPRPPRRPKTVRKSLQDITKQSNIEAQNSDIILERVNLYDPRVQRELITPSVYSFEETVTHGTLLVKPLDGAKLVPDSQLSRERLIPITQSDEEETSEVPESFKRLKNPEEVRLNTIQVSNLDVDTLTVNQLLASRAVVSDIDSSTITTNDIRLRELPQGLLEQLLKHLQQPAGTHEVSPEPPAPPPRTSTLDDQTSSNKGRTMLEPDIDDEIPPPRPPQPLEESLYLPSQPPASFYALRAKQQLVDENIPRRRRKSRPLSLARSRSTSTDSLPRPSTGRRMHHDDPTATELSGQLIRLSGRHIQNLIKRLIYHVSENVLRNADGNQDIHVFMIILLVLIAGLILLSASEDRTVVHLHHWEYFNPPRDI